MALSGALAAAQDSPRSPQAVLEQYCYDCHGSAAPEANLSIKALDLANPVSTPEAWEEVIRKLRHRQMPPPGRPRPSEAEYAALLRYLEEPLDQRALAHPKPGLVPALRRLSRTEYQNAIRDLLDLQVDAAALLPNDELSHGFDNVNLTALSPTLLERYIQAAQKISRLAVGAGPVAPKVDVVRLRPDLTQEDHVEGLPLGTRGGVLVPYHFPLDGEYEIQVTLARDRNEHVEGLKDQHKLELLLDRALVESFSVQPPVDREDHSLVDAHLKARVDVSAGPHQLGVTFVQDGAPLIETKRQPFQAHFNMHRHPRLTPAVFQVTITGPYAPRGVSDTPSRRRIFSCTPDSGADEEACARGILSTLARRAYRRPVNDADVEKLLAFYRAGRAGGAVST